eukprot:gene4376-biopygen884
MWGNLVQRRAAGAVRGEMDRNAAPQAPPGKCTNQERPSTTPGVPESARDQGDLANSSRQSEAGSGRLSAGGCQSESGRPDFLAAGNQDESGPSRFRDVQIFGTSWEVIKTTGQLSFSPPSGYTPTMDIRSAGGSPKCQQGDAAPQAPQRGGMRNNEKNAVPQAPPERGNGNGGGNDGCPIVVGRMLRAHPSSPRSILVRSLFVPPPLSAACAAPHAGGHRPRALHRTPAPRLAQGGGGTKADADRTQTGRWPRDRIQRNAGWTWTGRGQRRFSQRGEPDHDLDGVDVVRDDDKLRAPLLHHPRAAGDTPCSSTFCTIVVAFPAMWIFRQPLARRAIFPTFSQNEIPGI